MHRQSLAVWFLALMISSLSVGAATLDTYLPGGVNQSGFIDGDKLFTFTGFTLTTSCSDSTGAVTCPAGNFTPASASGLNVLPSSTMGITGLGLDGFVLQGGITVTSFFDSNSLQANVTEDILLTYTVNVLNPGNLISDVHLGFNGSRTPPGVTSNPPNTTITETFSNGAQLVVTNPPASFTDSANFTPAQFTSSLTVSKDIVLNSGACANCGAQISAIEQSFSQVPEPSGYAFALGIGFVGLLIYRRRTA